MKSKVMSCLALLVAMSSVSQMNVISLLSVVILLFTLNSSVVWLIGSKHIPNNLKHNRYYCYLISKFENIFTQLSQLISNFMQNKLTIDLSDVEKSVSQMSFCGNSLDIRTECKEVSRLITDNYIDFWYESIGTDNNEFVFECREILENLFCNLFDKCSQKLDKQKFWQKFLNLLESHLIAVKDDQNLSVFVLNERRRMDSIIERVLRLTATQEIVYVIPNGSQRSQTFSIYLMIKAMLRHSVFIPIVDIIADQKFIYKNICYLVTNSDLKLVDKDNHLEKRIDESFNLDFKDQLKSIDSIDCSRRTASVESYDQNLMEPKSSAEDNLQKASELSDNESNDDLIVEALEADEEFDSKIISNLVISQTKEMKDLFGPSYVLYLIEFDGLFRQMVDIPDNSSGDCQESCLVRNRVSVYRRFSEFISLQKVLEKNKTFIPLLKGIQKPSAIQITTQNLFSFAGTSATTLDASTIEFRRIYLQNFLIQLCNRKIILESAEMHQFLGYGSDGSIAFVNNTRNLLPLNIDKMLFRGVKGAISIMKSALPIEPQIGKIDPQFGDRTIPETEKLTIRSIETKVESESQMHLENKVNNWIEKGSDEEECDDFVISKTAEKYQYTSELRVTSLGMRTLGDGCEDPNALELTETDSKSRPIDEIDSQTKQSTSSQSNSGHITRAINCLVLFTTNNIRFLKQLFWVKIVVFVFGKVVQRFIDEVLSRLVTGEVIVRQIHSLHSALWPEEPTQVQNETEVQSDQYLDLTVDAIYECAKKRSHDMSPYLMHILDKLKVRHLLSNTLSKLKNSKTNKVFLYNFFELILDEIE